MSLAVITVLISILLPSFQMVRESARRVQCASNLRQIGLGLHMYGQSSNDHLPPSVYLPASAGPRSNIPWQPELMDTLRTDPSEFPGRAWGDWDGLGLLFQSAYLSAPGVYYCPSHPGDHPFDRYRDVWNQESGEIISNYQYRGIGPRGHRRLDQIDSNAALVTDMLRSFRDLNHKGGFNLLQVGLAVTWFEDTGDEIAGIMARQGGGTSSQAVTDAWTRLDGSNSSGGSSGVAN